MKRENQEIICKCKEITDDLETKIVTVENKIIAQIKDKCSVEEISKTIDDLMQIMRNVKYKCGLLFSEFELYNDGRLASEFYKGGSVLNFLMKTEIAPRDVKVIEEIHMYFVKNIKFSSRDIVLIDGKNSDEIQEIQSLSSQGKLKFNWFKNYVEMRLLFIILEDLKKLPEVIKYLDSR